MKTLVALVAVCASLTFAQAQSYIALLDPSQEVNPPNSNGAGSGSADLSLSGVSLSLSGSFSGLSGTYTASHIHGPAAAGFNAGVLYDLAPYFTGGGSAGSWNGIITLGDIGAYSVAQQISDLNNGLWYINVHSSPTFGGGEIRGQILIPEPSTLALLGLGAAGVLSVRRRRS